MSCPPIEQLLALTQSKLSEGATASILVHLEGGCPQCRRRLSQLREVSSLLVNWVLREPPAWLHQRALALFDHQRKSCQTGSPRTLGLLVADSFGQEILVGFRRLRRTSQQMLYRAGDYDIDLYLDYGEPTHDIQITGQVTPLSGRLETVAGAQVELSNPSGVVAATRANGFGAFLLDDVPERTYDLAITLKDEQLYIPDLEVRAPDG